MTKQAKWVLIGLFLLPVAACMGVAIAAANGVWEPYGGTYRMIFTYNVIVTVFGALFSWLLLRKAEGDLARWVAAAPTLLPAGLGTIWYLWRALVPAEVAAGAEYVGGPQYLLMGVFAVAILVLLLRITGLVPRTA